MVEKFFSKKLLLFIVNCLLLIVFLVELFYAFSLKSELSRREKQLEQAVAREEEKVVTPAMLRKVKR